MQTARPVKITSTAQKDTSVKGKSYMMYQAKDGRYCPIDPTWPIGGPNSIAMSAVAQIAPSEYAAEKATEKIDAMKARVGGITPPGPGGKS